MKSCAFARRAAAATCHFLPFSFELVLSSLYNILWAIEYIVGMPYTIYCKKTKKQKKNRPLGRRRGGSRSECCRRCCSRRAPCPAAPPLSLSCMYMDICVHIHNIIHRYTCRSSCTTPTSALHVCMYE